MTSDSPEKVSRQNTKARLQVGEEKAHRRNAILVSGSFVPLCDHVCLVLRLYPLRFAQVRRRAAVSLLVSGRENDWRLNETLNMAMTKTQGPKSLRNRQKAMQFAGFSLPVHATVRAAPMPINTRRRIYFS